MCSLLLIRVSESYKFYPREIWLHCELNILRLFVPDIICNFLTRFFSELRKFFRSIRFRAAAEDF